MVATVPPLSVRMRLRACLAKILSECGVMLGPTRSIASWARSASVRAWSRIALSRDGFLFARAAAWFAEHDPTLRAQHLDRAEDAAAPGAYLQAAMTQRAAYHVETALALAERGLALVRDTAERHALACLKGELQRDLGDVAGSIATFRDAVAAAPDAISRCRAALGLADGLRVSDGLEEALALLQSAQQIAEQKELVPELARLHHLRGNVPSFLLARSMAAAPSMSRASLTPAARARQRPRLGPSEASAMPPMRRDECAAPLGISAGASLFARSTDWAGSRWPTARWSGSAGSGSPKCGRP
jgi:tetratricopeptide (TPR) repeat protein